MSQQDILKVLESYPETEYTVKQISVIMNVNNSCIGTCMKKLRQFKFVNWRREKHHGKPIYYYKHKKVK